MSAEIMALTSNLLLATSELLNEGEKYFIDEDSLKFSMFGTFARKHSFYNEAQKFVISGDALSKEALGEQIYTEEIMSNC